MGNSTKTSSWRNGRCYYGIQISCIRAISTKDYIQHFFLTMPHADSCSTPSFPLSLSLLMTTFTASAVLHTRSMYQSHPTVESKMCIWASISFGNGCVTGSNRCAVSAGGGLQKWRQAVELLFGVGLPASGDNSDGSGFGGLGEEVLVGVGRESDESA